MMYAFASFFIEDENLVFRGNSFATKAMDSYMKMIGESVSQCSYSCTRFILLLYLYLGLLCEKMLDFVCLYVLSLIFLNLSV